jgi:hypothetical protein
MNSNSRVKNYLMVPLVLLIIQVIANYGLFLGDTVFDEEDVLGVLSQSAGNISSMGWRSDLGMGVSYFFADPGAQHTWSLFRWWHQIFTDQILAYHISIFLLLWLMSLTHHVLLKKIFPELNPIVLIFLASLVSVGSLRYEFFFIRHHAILVIATPIIALIIFNYLERPSTNGYFQYTAILFFTLFLGSATSILFSFMLAGIFLLSYIFYHRRTLKIKGFFKKFLGFFSLNFFSGLTVVLLGAWVFYTIFLESQLVEYVRDSKHEFDGSLDFISPRSIFSNIFEYFHAGLISPTNGVLGINQFLPIGSWNNVSPVFPLIFILCFFLKSQNFWEFSAKFVVFFSFMYILIASYYPPFRGAIHSVLNLYPPKKLYPFIHTFQVILIGFLIQRVLHTERRMELKKKIVVIFATILSVLYGLMLILAILVLTKPSFIIKAFTLILNQLPPLYLTSDTENIIRNILRENILLFQENLIIPDLLFYLTTLVISILFISHKWMDVTKWKHGVCFAAILLINNFFLTWSVYPMNKEPLIWDKQVSNGASLSNIFKETDRIAWVGTKPCRGRENYFSCINKKFIETPFGARRYFVGYRLSKPMNFSGLKSFSPKSQALYLEALLHHENIHSNQAPRYLSSRPPISKSKAFDLNAVNYLLSEDPLTKSDHLDLIHASKQFFLYRNNQARPYFYLADRIQPFYNMDELYQAQKRTAYLKKNTVSLNSSPHQRKLKLLEFKAGNLKFRYSSKNNEFLVIRDTWHPFWRATVNGIETKVVKTNGTFKGIVLPSGQGYVNLFFDYSNYFSGIWISLVVWVAFILGWVVSSSKKMKRFLLLQPN